MPTAGDLLRQAREARQWSLDHVAGLTHIRMRYLTAIEEDRRTDLPSAVQARGYIRLYATIVGLPAQHVLDAWEGLTATDATPEQPAPIGDQVGVLPEQSPEELLDESPSESATGVTVWQSQLKAIGADLRSRRQSLGITLDEVEKHSHIRLHYLKALEAGDLERLPSIVQGRGMLNGYAAFLNMDVDAVMLRFGDALQLRREALIAEEEAQYTRRKTPKPAPEVVENPDQSKLQNLWFRFRRYLTPDILVGGGLVMIVFFFILWGVGQVIPSEELNQETPVVISVPTQTTTGLASQGEPTAETPEPVATEMPAQSDFGGTPTVTVNPNASIQVVITTYQRAYVHVTADNKDVFTGRVTPGNVYAFSANGKMRILTGNGAAIGITYNSQNLGVVGLQGQVLDMTFTLQGIITPTPEFVPTATLPATLTPQPSPTAPTPTVTPYIP